jgi:hypothetical protein
MIRIDLFNKTPLKIANEDPRTHLFLCNIVVYVKILLTIKSWKHSPLHRCLGYIHNKKGQEILRKTKRAAPEELPLTRENLLRNVASSLSVAFYCC